MMEKSGSLTISHNWISFFFFIYENSKFASFQSDEGLYMHFKTQGLEVNPSTHTHTLNHQAQLLTQTKLDPCFHGVHAKIPTRPSE